MVVVVLSTAIPVGSDDVLVAVVMVIVLLLGLATLGRWRGKLNFHWGVNFGVADRDVSVVLLAAVKVSAAHA